MEIESDMTQMDVPAKVEQPFSSWERIMPENFSLLSVTMKIKGEYLKIENMGDNHYLWFVRENGDVDCFKMSGGQVSLRAKSARTRIQRLRRELSTAKSPKRMRLLKAQVEVEQMKFIWPQLLIAHCRGEDLTRFFTIRPKKPNNAEELSARYSPKHKTVKDEVNKLLQSLRIERPETTLEESKHVYANLMGDSYSNINRLYHYRAKK